MEESKLHDFPYGKILWARPDQPLEQHLSSLRKNIHKYKFKIPFFQLPSDALGIQSDETIHLPHWLVMDLMSILVACHDFGKLSPHFQYKIIGNKLPKQQIALSYHTKTSGFFAYYLLDEYFHQYKKEIVNNLPDSRIFKIIRDTFTASITYSIINHHTPKLSTTLGEKIELENETLITIALLVNHVYPQKFIVDIPNEVHNKESSVAELLQAALKLSKPAEHIIEKALERLKELVDPIDLEITLETTDIREMDTNWLYDLYDELEELWEQTQEKPLLFNAFLFMHSMLGNLDEWDARTFHQNSDQHDDEFDWDYNCFMPFDSVDRFRIKKFGSINNHDERSARIISLRNNLYENVRDTSIPDNPSAFIIEAPTGAAKTLAMINLALKLAKKQHGQTGKTPRIIYALPFVSITDQVGEVIKEVLKQNNISTKNLIVHHQYSEFPEYVFEPMFDEDKEEVTITRALTATKLWHAPIIATTFVSLMNTIFSGVKRSILRFHRIAGSIIILDEVQSIPPRHWEIVSMTLDHLIRHFNSNIIIGSATNPKPLSNSIRNTVKIKPDTKPLQMVNRYTLKIEHQPQTIDQFIERFSEPVTTMIVVNTRKSCRTIYDNLIKKFPENHVFLLSTWLRPIDRKRTIKTIQQRLKHNLTTILVTTQVVEAGVDLSFDTVYRDFAPLDSIIQVAGRCNRNFEREMGTVNLINLVNENNSPFAPLIYDKVSLEATKELLENVTELDELELRKLTHRYYSNIAQRRVTSKALKERMITDIPKLSQTFKLIEERPQTSLAIVPKRYLQILNFQRKTTIKVLNLFTIAISHNDLKNIKHKKRKISGTEVRITTIEECDNYSKKAGLSV